jgi:hypothetical protein
MVDAVLLYLIAGTLLRQVRRILGLFMIAAMSFGGIAFLLAIVDNLSVRIVAATLVVIAFVVVAWTRLLDDDERRFLLELTYRRSTRRRSRSRAT